MLFKQNKCVKPDLPKEYVWALEIDDVDHEFKCLVTEDEVIDFVLNYAQGNFTDEEIGSVVPGYNDNWENGN